MFLTNKYGVCVKALLLCAIQLYCCQETIKHINESNYFFDLNLHVHPQFPFCLYLQ